MIARKITYFGNFDDEALGHVYDITRKNEITGQVKRVNIQEVELNLEGDPAQIKLIQHQIERKIKPCINNKVITQIPYQYYVGLTLLN